MNWIIIALLFLACVFIGYIFSLKYRKRYNFFRSLVLLCQKLDVEINYSRERLKNLFLNFDDKTKRNLQGLDKNFLEYLENNKSLEEGNLFKNINFLKQNEKDMIFVFFKSLGRSDLDNQSKELKNYEKRFEELSSLATTENKRYGTLSIKLGVVAGLMIVILLC